MTMKNDDLLMIGGLAVGVFLIAMMGSKRAAAATPAAGSRTPAKPGTPTIVGAITGEQYGATVVKQANGWTYYSDGTATDPFGSYYYQGQKVYDSVWGDQGS